MTLRLECEKHGSWGFVPTVAFERSIDRYSSIELNALQKSDIEKLVERGFVTHKWSFNGGTTLFLILPDELEKRVLGLIQLEIDKQLR